MLQLGYFLRDKRKNNTESFNWFLRSAKKGNNDEQFVVGMVLLHEGRKDKAVKWFEKSAENGSMWAQERLGEIYEEMEPVNPERALFWYQKAANQGYTYAAYRVCHYLHNGITVKRCDYRLGMVFNWCGCNT